MPEQPAFEIQNNDTTPLVHEAYLDFNKANPNIATLAEITAARDQASALFATANSGMTNDVPVFNDSPEKHSANAVGNIGLKFQEVRREELGLAA